MDNRHLFHSPGTYLLVRLEHIALVVACLALVVMHLEEVNWVRFITAFALIDVVGYIPGAVAARRLGPSVPAIFHHLYNTAHSYLTWLLLVTPWALAVGGLEWAMLAVPIHLSGDRGLFGNIFKPVSIPFEPGARASPAPDWAQVRKRQG